MTDIDPIKFTLHCRKCGARLTKPLAALDDGCKLVGSDSEPLLPAGRFAASELVLVEGEAFYGVKERSLMINTNDLDGAQCLDRNMGCCGPGGDVPDLDCPKGHTVGTMVGDCWQPHFCHFPLEWVSLEPVREPAGVVRSPSERRA